MAASWLKMRHDLADDPAVIRVAADVSIEEDAVIGKLFRLWSWADRHTTDGRAAGIGLGWVDRHTGCQGFGAALVRAGWLVESDAGLSFPRFDRHCSDTAKARAQGLERVQRHRNAPSVTRPLPEEEIEEEVPPPPREASLLAGSSQDAWRTLQAAWNAGSGRQWTPPDPPDGLADRLAEVGWLDAALQAIGRLPGCRYFVTKVTLIQFVGRGFVGRVLDGHYDTPKPAKGRGGHDERPPAEGFGGDDLARFESTKKRLAAKLKIAGDT